MRYELPRENDQQHFMSTIEKMSGQNIRLCYQCGKCSAGCPICQEMDASPNQIIRYIQLGLKEQSLSKNTIWLCASCQTCSTRCPQQLDLAKIMDSLRILYQHESLQQSVPFSTSAKDFGHRFYNSLLNGLQMDVRSNVNAFSNLFLKMVRHYGRQFETGLIYNYNVNSGFLFSNVLKGPMMLMKAKINLIPENVKRREKVEKIFSKVEQFEKAEKEKR